MSKKEESGDKTSKKINDGKCCRCIHRNSNKMCNCKKSKKNGQHVPRKGTCNCFKYND